MLGILSVGFEEKGPEVWLRLPFCMGFLHGNHWVAGFIHLLLENGGVKKLAICCLPLRGWLNLSVLYGK